MGEWVEWMDLLNAYTFHVGLSLAVSAQPFAQLALPLPVHFGQQQWPIQLHVRAVVLFAGGAPFCQCKDSQQVVEFVKSSRRDTLIYL